MITSSLKRSLALAVATAFLCGTQALAVVITKTNTTTGLFDASSGTRAFNFNLAEAGGTITDVDISVRFGKHDGQSFGFNGGGTPYYNEIVFSLTKDAGPTANLISENSWSSGSGGFLDRTITFDESAAQVVNFAGAPLAGTYRTTGFAGGFGLNQFNGLTLTPGAWTLYIADTVGSDALDFYSATLNVTVNNAVPDSSTTIILLGLAIGAMGAARRKSLRSL